MAVSEENRKTGKLVAMAMVKSSAPTGVDPGGRRLRDEKERQMKSIDHASRAPVPQAACWPIACSASGKNTVAVIKAGGKDNHIWIRRPGRLQQDGL